LFYEEKQNGIREFKVGQGESPNVPDLYPFQSRSEYHKDKPLLCLVLSANKRKMNTQILKLISVTIFRPMWIAATFSAHVL